jgi:hypothetical protein
MTYIHKTKKKKIRKILRIMGRLLACCLMWPRAHLLFVVLAVVGRQASRKLIRDRGRASLDRHRLEPNRRRRRASIVSQGARVAAAAKNQNEMPNSVCASSPRWYLSSLRLVCTLICSHFQRLVMPNIKLYILITYLFLGPSAPWAHGGRPACPPLSRSCRPAPSPTSGPDGVGSCLSRTPAAAGMGLRVSARTLCLP